MGTKLKQIDWAKWIPVAALLLSVGYGVARFHVTSGQTIDALDEIVRQVQGHEVRISVLEDRGLRTN